MEGGENEEKQGQIVPERHRHGQGCADENQYSSAIASGNSVRSTALLSDGFSDDV